MLYQLAVKLFKTLNEQGYDLRFEQVTVLDQIVCTRRQLTFKIYRKNRAGETGSMYVVSYKVHWYVHI